MEAGLPLMGVLKTCGCDSGCPKDWRMLVAVCGWEDPRALTARGEHTLQSI